MNERIEENTEFVWSKNLRHLKCWTKYEIKPPIVCSFCFLSSRANCRTLFFHALFVFGIKISTSSFGIIKIYCITCAVTMASCQMQFSSHISVSINRNFYRSSNILVKGITSALWCALVISFVWFQKYFTDPDVSRTNIFSGPHS